MFAYRIATWLVMMLMLLVGGRSSAAPPADLGGGSFRGAKSDNDESAIDRALKREPKYAEKPRYCLLVFGPEARTKVWLVLDGEDLYADLNANGDITESGERFSPQNRRDLGASPNGGYRDWKYQLGEVAPLEEATKHTRFEISSYQTGDKPLCQVICVWVNGAVQQYAGWGPLFERRREDAPVIHFGAPVICRPLRSHSISRSAKSPEIHFCLGTPGRGKHSFAYIGYETVPKDLQPRLEIQWPTASGDPKRTEAALDGRC